jgi:hypothetical protein
MINVWVLETKQEYNADNSLHQTDFDFRKNRIVLKQIFLVVQRPLGYFCIILNSETMYLITDFRSLMLTKWCNYAQEVLIKLAILTTFQK